MALKAGYYGIKKFIADKLNRMNPGDSFATDAEIAAAADKVRADIAPVLEEAKAPAGGITAGDQFYLNDILYTASANIAAGANIVTTGEGKNADVSSNVTEQLSQKVSRENTTSVVTQSTDLVESGAVYDALGFGNKNLFDKSNIQGIDVTVTQSSDSFRVQTSNHTWSSGRYDVNNPSKNTDFILSCKANVNTAGNFMRIQVYGSNDGADYTSISATDNYSTTTDLILAFNSGNYEYIRIIFYLTNGTASSADVTFEKPMIRLASVTDATYEPYHRSVSDSLAEKADITALGTQEGATASKLYHPGEHFYKDGKFCTVIGSADVAAESTWTLNTNYVEGTIADNLVKQTTFSGTTDANGNLKILDGISVNVLGCDISNSLGLVMKTTSNTYVKALDYNTLAAKTNADITGKYYYY